MKPSLKIEMGAKDFSGRYIDINEVLLSNMGYKKREEVVGRSEYDIGQEIFAETIGGSDALVSGFLKSDEEAFRGKELTALDVHVWRGKLRFRIAKKYPGRNEKGKIFAAAHSALEIFQPSVQVINHYLALEEKGLFISAQAREHIQWYLNDFLKNIPLNNRELECINQLAKGKTAKEIAQQLNLSNRTVEFYLDNARAKLKCANRYELVGKCFQKGWLDTSMVFNDEFI